MARRRKNNLVRLTNGSAFGAGFRFRLKRMSRRGLGRIGLVDRGLLDSERRPSKRERISYL